MQKQRIAEAKHLAKRFIKSIDELERVESEVKSFGWSNPKQSGAVRRASMDLTRALAEMRKP